MKHGEKSPEKKEQRSSERQHNFKRPNMCVIRAPDQGGGVGRRTDTLFGDITAEGVLFSSLMKTTNPGNWFAPGLWYKWNVPTGHRK